MDTAYDLERFVAAQEPVYAAVKAELSAGHKRTHWMWFIFPQLKALGRSSIARHYGIASAEEARRYLAHPVLGPRLRECVGIVNAVQGRSAHQIFGTPDDLKFRSCLTLFEAVAADKAVFESALDKYYGERDPLTLSAP